MTSNSTTKSYSQILQSTTILGATSVITILMGIVRNKVLAVFIGPSGIGEMSLYTSIYGIMSEITGMGVGYSGVREISYAKGKENLEIIARTIFVLRRLSFILGFLGLILLIALSDVISLVTFGSVGYSKNICFLSIIIVFTAITNGQIALLQGLRRISELAKSNILGSLIGILVGLPVVALLKTEGIVTYLILLSASSTIASWWFARKTKTGNVKINFSTFVRNSSTMIKFGSVFMLNGLMSIAAMYYIRVTIIHELGMPAAGLYQAALNLSHVYLGILLSAIGKDFYPRLVENAADNNYSNQLVNEQIELGILFAFPGIVATIFAAPYIIKLFYSESFIYSYDILKWSILGAFLRIISWPLGIVLIAKSLKMKYFLSDLALNGFQIFLIVMGIKYFGLLGTGLAYFCSYLLYAVLVFFLVKQVSGFIFFKSVKISLCVVIVFVFTSLYLTFATFNCHLFVFASLFVISLLYSLNRIKKVLGISEIKQIISIVFHKKT